MCIHHVCWQCTMSYNDPYAKMINNYYVLITSQGWCIAANMLSNSSLGGCWSSTADGSPSSTGTVLVHASKRSSNSHFPSSCSDRRSPISLSKKIFHSKADSVEIHDWNFGISCFSRSKSSLAVEGGTSAGLPVGISCKYSLLSCHWHHAQYTD